MNGKSNVQEPSVWAFQFFYLYIIRAFKKQRYGNVLNVGQIGPEVSHLEILVSTVRPIQVIDRVSTQVS